jgi:hypothetical protein
MSEFVSPDSILKLQCLIGPGEVSSESASIDIRFATVDGCWIRTIVTVDVGRDLQHGSNAHAAVPISFSGYSILQFVNELELLRGLLVGSARLWAYYPPAAICVSASDTKRGHIVIGGCLDHRPSWPGALCEDGESDRNSGALCVRFDGFAIDQSYIPYMVSAMRALLATTGVSTSNPDL